MAIQLVTSAVNVGSSLRSDAFVLQSVPQNYARFLAPALFEPWARLLVELVGVAAGMAVLDVATGTGLVARLAARFLGATGRVVASDISAAMLEVAQSERVEPDAAPIEWVQAPAAALRLPDRAFDVALCHQGLPFFTDRPAAVREIRRVLRSGGVAGLSVWAAGYPLAPFQAYIDVLSAHGVPAPFPGAYDEASYVMNEAEVETLLARAGFSSIEVRTVDLEVSWPDREAVVSGILGTPFGPSVAALPTARRDALLADLGGNFGEPDANRPVTRATSSVLARAVA